MFMSEKIQSTIKGFDEKHLTGAFNAAEDRSFSSNPIASEYQ